MKPHKAPVGYEHPSQHVVNPTQMRWQPPAASGASNLNFVESLITVGGSGDPATKAGVSIMLWNCEKSMVDTALVNADGDLLLVPQTGAIDVTTELGKMWVEPGEICVIQRGIPFSINVVDERSSGYIAEIYGGHFKLPDLGPIGANGLADPRHFKTVTAYCDPVEKQEREFTVIHKFAGEWFSYQRQRTIYDVVGWQGNYIPFKYNLDNFCPMNAVRFDHADPSIFTVLTCQSNTPGVAVLDFVIFPPRFGVQLGSFRPPYYHRNIMSEYMGNIRGVYEAKKKGFSPGAGSLHNTMSGHGPDAQTFQKESTKELVPELVSWEALAFMFESCYTLKVSRHANANYDADYYKVWEGLKPTFTPDQI